MRIDGDVRHRWREPQGLSMRPYLAEVAAAFAFLTRLPVGRWAGPRVDDALVSSTWAYPLVGGVVGALGGLAYWLLDALALPPTLCAVVTIGAIVMATGALHEDGLADTADGFGGGSTRARKLEIMHDHQIGTYGAVALVLALALRTVALASLREPALVLVSLIAAGAVSRAGMAGLMCLLPPARPDGLAARICRQDRGPALVAAAFGALISLLALPLSAALLVIAVGGIACLAVAALARRQIDGVTGDVLGAAQQTSECAVLTVLCAALR
jgi:adenosylcobinamide-GDP ribazoletransferase